MNPGYFDITYKYCHSAVIEQQTATRNLEHAPLTHTRASFRKL